MKLTFQRCHSASDLRMHPAGYYWYAQTDDGMYDGSGSDGLSAVVDMVEQMEREMGMTKETKEKVKGD